jgi:hypothetical protein
MSIFDKAINVAADVARSSSAAHQRAQRRRAVEDQLTLNHQAIQWSTIRVGQLALGEAARGRPLPEAARPPAEAIARWHAEIADLERHLRQLDSGGSGGPGGTGRPG